MSTVSIIGSGNVGANTAFFIVEKGITDVVLHDIEGGRASGKALDIMQAAPLRGYRNRLRAASTLVAAVAEAEVVVLAVGAVRKPGMKRDDLLQVNGPVVEELGAHIGRLAPAAKVIVTTEPVDPATRIFRSAAGMPRRQVMGVGGVLDATRFRHGIAHELGVSSDDVTAMVIGRHGDPMVFLPRYSRVGGVPLPQLMAPDRIEALERETREAGDLIVELAQRSSAYYAPSAAVAELVDAIHMDLKRILSVSVVLEGEYDMEGTALSLPCVIGANGIERVLQPVLTDAERLTLRASVADEAAARWFQ